MGKKIRIKVHDVVDYMCCMHIHCNLLMSNLTILGYLFYCGLYKKCQEMLTHSTYACANV